MQVLTLPHQVTSLVIPMHKKCPLTGEECNKSKHFHVTELRDGEPKSFDLCSQCVVQYHSKIQGLVEESPKEEPSEKKKKKFGPAELMKLLISPPKGLEVTPHISNKSCENCGRNLQDFSSQGRMGCPKCYEYFAKELKPLLMTAHGAVKHVGKVPKNWAKQKQLAELTFDHINDRDERMRKMKEKMAAVIKEEKYEDAAIIKNKIEELKADSPSSPPPSLDQ